MTGKELVRGIIPILAILILGGCPSTYTVREQDDGDDASVQASDISIQYLRDPRTPSLSCLGDAFEDLRTDLGALDSNEFWQSLFPEPLHTVQLSQLLEDSEFRSRALALDVKFLLVVTRMERRSEDVKSVDFGVGGAGRSRKVFELSAALWSADDGRLIGTARAQGSGVEAAGAVVPFFVGGFVPYGMETATCEAVAKNLAATLGERAERARFVILGRAGIGTVDWDYHPWIEKKLSTRAWQGDRDAYYKLAAHFWINGALSADWIADTQYRLGKLPSDYTETGFTTSDKWIWLCRAANRGHPEAQASMGDSYWNGTRPVRQDKPRGYMWYSLAAQRGSERAKSRIDELKPAPEEIREAEMLASRWRPNPASCEHEATGSSPSP